jgi:hypothetical protein
MLAVTPYPTILLFVLENIYTYFVLSAHICFKFYSADQGLERVPVVTPPRVPYSRSLHSSLVITRSLKLTFYRCILRRPLEQRPLPPYISSGRDAVSIGFLLSRLSTLTDMIKRLISRRSYHEGYALVVPVVIRNQLLVNRRAYVTPRSGPQLKILVLSTLKITATRASWGDTAAAAVHHSNV